MGDAEVRIKIKVDAGDAKTALGEAAHAAGETKTAFGETAQASEGLGSAFEKIGRLAEASFWMEIINKVVELGEKLIEAAEDAERHDMALQALGETYTRISQATNDTVDETIAFRTQQQLLSADIDVTGDQLAALLGRAREYAVHTGTDLPSAVDRLTGALISGSERGLRPFGVELQHGGDHAANVSSALQQLQTQMANTTPTARTLAEDISLIKRGFTDTVGEMASFALEATGLRSVISSVASAFSGMGNEVHRSGSEIQHTAQQTQTAVQSMIAALGQLRTAQGQAAAPAANPNEVRTALTSGVFGVGAVDEHGNNAVRQAMGDLTRVLGHEATIQDLSPDAQREYERVLRMATDQDSTASQRAYAPQAAIEVLQRETNRIADERVRQQQVDHEAAVNADLGNIQQQAEQQRTHAEAIQRARRLGIHIPGAAGGAGGGSRSGDNLKDTIADRIALMRDELAIVESIKDRQAERVRLEREANAEVAQGLNAKAQEAEQAGAGEQFGDFGAALANQGNGRGKAGSFDKTGGMADAARAAGSFDAQFSQAFAHNADLTQTKAQEMAGSVVDAYGSMKSAFMEHLDAVVQGKETIGQALASMTRQILLHIGEEAAWKAILNLGEGIAALARGVASYGSDGGAVASAPQFFAAAAIYGGIAAATIGGGLAINPGGGGGGGMASYAGAGSSGGSANYGGGGGHGGGGSHVIDTSSNSRPVFGGSTAGTGGGVVNINVVVSGVMANDQTADTLGRTLENLRDRDRLPSIPQWGT